MLIAILHITYMIANGSAAPTIGENLKQNHKNMKISRILLMCTGMLTACSQPKEKKEEKNTEGVTVILSQEEELPAVEVEVLRNGKFAQEILSNGILSSVKKADLFWKASGIITHIHVRNGDRVRHGQVLAEIDKEKLELSLQQASDSRKRSYLDMQDFLIGQGYKISDSLSVPDNIKELASMKSGYGQACINYRSAQIALQEATLTAPFSGVVANLTAKPYNQTGSGGAFCTLLDNSSMEVEFPVMENEIRSLRQGDAVQVALYADEDDNAPGRIVSINPLIGENGLTKVCAIVPQTPKHWFDGMKVRVNIHRNTDGHLVVPKEAVVVRDGRRVAFTVRKSKAYWNYVTIGYENSSSYTITKGLKEGDSVIVSGNQNLAHFTPIAIKNNSAE